jgi:23S rRNA pseudouridine1911/1915/1917 synthase
MQQEQREHNMESPAPAATRTQLFAAGTQDSGQRLDKWLALQLPDASRSQVQDWIKLGAVLVNQVAEKASYRLVADDCIELHLETHEESPKVVGEAIPLDILHSDADILVVNKPAGMVVHPAPGHSQRTLVNALLHMMPELANLDHRRPGIVHRLDKDTSGVIVVAKHDMALRSLQQQFKQRVVQKEYLALVEGRVDPERGRINIPIGRHPTDRKRQAAFPTLGVPGANLAREAVTDYEIVALFTATIFDTVSTGNFTLIRAMPRTGRTHQIRVHMAYIKHPIVGDPIYGLRRQRLTAPRLFLHAHRLSFKHPVTGENLDFTSPLPADLTSVLNRLQAEA